PCPRDSSPWSASRLSSNAVRNRADSDRSDAAAGPTTRQLRRLLLPDRRDPDPRAPPAPPSPGAPKLAPEIPHARRSECVACARLIAEHLLHQKQIEIIIDVARPLLGNDPGAAIRSFERM